MANTSNWKNLERVVAERFGKAIGYKCLRNPMSGSANANDKGERRPGDVIVHSDFQPDVLLECKVRATHAHHKLFADAKKDARKNKLWNSILFTKVKGETGHLVVLQDDLFYEMLAIPAVQELLKKNEQRETPSPTSD